MPPMRTTWSKLRPKLLKGVIAVAAVMIERILSADALRKSALDTSSLLRH
jgi:hypothetical protein